MSDPVQAPEGQGPGAQEEPRLAADGPREQGEPAPPAFDIEAARARYRRQMRSGPVRAIFLIAFLILLCTWGLGGLAAFAPEVEQLPNHDLSVSRERCIDCHTRRLEGAPEFNHSFAPSCGFCHRQGPPPTPTVVQSLTFNVQRSNR